MLFSPTRINLFRLSIKIYHYEKNCINYLFIPISCWCNVAKYCDLHYNSNCHSNPYTLQSEKQQISSTISIQMHHHHSCKKTRSSYLNFQMKHISKNDSNWHPNDVIAADVNVCNHTLSTSSYCHSWTHKFFYTLTIKEIAKTKCFPTYIHTCKYCLKAIKQNWEGN